MNEMALCFTYVCVTTCNTTTNDYVDINQIQLEVGNTGTLFSVPSQADAIAAAQRFVECSYDIAANTATAPGTVTDNGASLLGTLTMTLSTFSNGADQYLNVPFKVSKFKAPAMTFYSPNTGTAAKAYDRIGTADVATAAAFATGTNGFSWGATPASVSAVLSIYVHWCAEAAL